MKHKVMYRIAVIACAIASLVLFASPTAAATSAPMTITATPSYIACTSSPDSWTINSTGNSLIVPNTQYYSNPIGNTTSPSDPVVDGECMFTLTNTSTITTDMFINMADFTGGSATMTNSNAGTNGATTFGAYSYCTGMTYSSGKVICKASGSDLTKADLAPTTNIKWGIAVKTRTDAWTGGTASTSVVTISLAAT